MNNDYIKRPLKAFLCLITAMLFVTLCAGSAFAETKEEIYESHSELDPFTDPEKFAEKYGLITEGDFDPENYSYFIYNLSTTVNVGEDNIVDVTELIDVYFKTSMNGIERRVPRYNLATMANGGHAMNYAKIYGVYSDSPVKCVTNGDEMIIRLGFSDIYYQGFKQYRLHYTIDLGKDALNNCDEFYFNIIDPYTGCPTLRSQFEITMPKSFDAQRLHFSNGQIGRIDESIYSYEVNENTIKGETIYHFNAGQALTCRILLPDGYFGNASNIYDMSSLVSLGAATLMAIICSIIIIRSRRANRFILRLEYYPPRELDPCEAAYLKNGRLDDKRIISLLPYLASKGYIGIRELSKGIGRLTRQSCGYIFTKRKDMRGLRADEKMFMEGMFGKEKKNDPSGEQPYINDETLRFRFFKTVEKIKYYQLNDNTSGCAMLFAKGGTYIKNIYMIIIMVLSSVGIAFPMSFDSTHTGEGFSFFTFILLTAILCAVIFAMKHLHILVRSIICIIIAAIGVSVVTFDGVTFFASEIAAYTSLIVMLVMCIFFDSVKMIRTPYGKTLYGRLMGFERFLKSGDYGMLEKLLEENPGYYYDILPYTFSLDITIPKNKTLEASYLSAPPEWFEITNEAGAYSFYNMTYMLEAALTDMTYHPTSGNEDLSVILGDSFKGKGL